MSTATTPSSTTDKSILSSIRSKPIKSRPSSRLNISKVKNLVFQGGSVKGISYGGAIGALDHVFTSKGYNLDTRILNVAGTSAGAITALALSLGTDVLDLVNTIGNTDFKSFLDTKAYKIVSNISSESTSAPTKSQAALETLPLLTSTMGLASGQPVLDYLESFVKQKTGVTHMTFGELHALVLEDRKNKKKDKVRKDLFVVAYNLTLDTPQVFGYKDTPDSVISDAVRCSLSIPFVFVPHKNYIKKLDEKGEEMVRVEASEDLWIDGGITDNYPIAIFDKMIKAAHEETLGFYLVSAEEKAEIEGDSLPTEHKPTRREVNNILDYAKAVIETVISSQQTSAHKQSKDIDRTIYIDHLGTSMMNFGLTLEQKNDLIASGWDAVCEKCGMIDQIGKCQVLLQEPADVEEAPSEGSTGKCVIC